MSQMNRENSGDNLDSISEKTEQLKVAVQCLTAFSDVAKTIGTLSEAALAALIGLGIGLFVMGSTGEPNPVKGLGVIITFSGSLTWVEKQMERKQQEKAKKEERKQQKELKEEQKEIEKLLQEKDKDCNSEFYNIKLSRLKDIYQTLSKYDSFSGYSYGQRFVASNEPFSNTQPRTEIEGNALQSNALSPAKEPGMEFPEEETQPDPEFSAKKTQPTTE